MLEAKPLFSRSRLEPLIEFFTLKGFDGFFILIGAF